MKISKKIIWIFAALQIAAFIPVSAATAGNGKSNTDSVKSIYQMPKLSNSDLKEIGDKIFKN